MKPSRKPIAKQRPLPHREDPEQPLLPLVAKALIRILPFTLAAGLVLSFAAAAFANSRPDPDAVLLPLALCIASLMSLLGGLLTFRATHRACLVCGLAFGASLVLLFCAISFLLPHRAALSLSGGIRWAVRGGMIAFSVLGALMGSYAPRKKRKKRKR